MTQQDCKYWIGRLELQPHPEGGFYKEVFRSTEKVYRENSTSEVKAASSSIYYLLEGSDYSGFHRIKSDEIWYFHKGVALNVHVINEDGNHEILELSDSETGNLSLVVKAGLWFAASVRDSVGFALVSCAVAPGFDFTEFEMAKKEELKAFFPKLENIIDAFSRD